MGRCTDRLTGDGPKDQRTDKLMQKTLRRHRRMQGCNGAHDDAQEN